MLNAQVNSGDDDSPGLLNAVGPKKTAEVPSGSSTPGLPSYIFVHFCTHCADTRVGKNI